jgi:hypothetical protein
MLQTSGFEILYFQDYNIRFLLIKESILPRARRPQVLRRLGQGLLVSSRPLRTPIISKIFLPPNYVI